ncbi:phosphatidic acid phosphatase type 2/haloperoxidase [Rhypophila decipiens]|uniref:Phosphatidic acid phosphatase type 2/haloperoxidase n=1 Tax=Rhypophila decipiens TaxID=261697 RepID=A0AAN6Y6K9_9PEZI|nr:phosphatidic acid phosphatase type 2/haloperoxidase [Rhypophila decipiens]
MCPSDHGSPSSGLEPFPEATTPPPPYTAQTASTNLTEKGSQQEPNGTPVVDAGLKSLDHYKRALPKWRYTLRQRLLPLVRWETPYLAMIQSTMRTPALDSYFAITANLGTHTFFMIFLPILFWCGFRDFGKGLVHILALGVFWSGFLKDLCSLPRPLSPPLQRITMSGNVALEYGFPSTHSANAVSVVVYAVLLLRDPERNIFSPGTSTIIEGLTYFYAVSIVFGRLYCGMHGFLDVLFGSAIGAVISLVEVYYAPRLEAWIYGSSYLAPLVIAVVIVVLVRIHPEPADDCPCFDDSVAFAGVMIGIEFGCWHLARSQWSSIYVGTEASFDLGELGWPIAVARVVFGVLVIFAWREVMKPTLLFALPHLYRVFETHGLSLPRRFFVPASEYKDVPLHVRDDNVLPNVSDFPKMVRSLKGPGRGRSVSIGPQSAADAYETLAYRERRRRESLESDGGAGVKSRSSLMGLRERAQDDEDGQDQNGKCSAASGVQHQGGGGRLARYEAMMGLGTTTAMEGSAVSSPDRALSPEVDQQDELGEKEMFSMLVKPRVRYDVEVVTKLVVYAGIAMFAVDFIPIIFEFVGLGFGHLAVK